MAVSDLNNDVVHSDDWGQFVSLENQPPHKTIQPLYLTQVRTKFVPTLAPIVSAHRPAFVPLHVRINTTYINIPFVIIQNIQWALNTGFRALSQRILG